MYAERKADEKRRRETLIKVGRNQEYENSVLDKIIDVWDHTEVRTSYNNIRQISNILNTSANMFLRIISKTSESGLLTLFESICRIFEYTHMSAMAWVVPENIYFTRFRAM